MVREHLHEGLHATRSSPPIFAALHSAELVQVLKQDPGLLDGAPQLPPPHVHLRPQTRPAATPAQLSSEGAFTAGWG